MVRTRTPRSISVMFEPPYTRLWLPAFAAAAIADPVAAKALGPYLGPSDQPIEGGTRMRVPGDVHFNETWKVIKPGFLRKGRSGYAKHTNQEHRRTKIPGRLLSLPIQWIQVMTATIALNDDPQLVPMIWRAGERFAGDINADLAVVKLPHDKAKANMANYFAGVKIAPEQGKAFWGALNMDPVRRDLGRIHRAAVEKALDTHLPSELVNQFMRY